MTTYGKREISAYLFPGQGSQHRGMGGGLFRRFEHLTRTSDELLGYPIEELCLQNPQGKLSRTEFAQPAIYVTNVMHYLAARADGMRAPDYLAGHSLGEYCALFAAESYDFETGLKLVEQRGKVMGRSAEGKMMAIVGVREELVEKALGLGAFSNIEIANYNSPTQVVVAGPRQELEGFGELLRSAGGRAMLLDVAAAFHSKYMAAAAAEFSRYLETVTFGRPEIPVLSNVLGRPYADQEIRPSLARQIDSPVRWSEIVRYLARQGSLSVVEAGSRAVLTRLVAENQAAMALA